MVRSLSQAVRRSCAVLATAVVAPLIVSATPSHAGLGGVTVAKVSVSPITADLAGKVQPIGVNKSVSWCNGFNFGEIRVESFTLVLQDENGWPVFNIAAAECRTSPLGLRLGAVPVLRAPEMNLPMTPIRSFLEISGTETWEAETTFGNEIKPDVADSRLANDYFAMAYPGPYTVRTRLEYGGKVAFSPSITIQIKGNRLGMNEVFWCNQGNYGEKRIGIEGSATAGVIAFGFRCSTQTFWGGPRKKVALEQSNDCVQLSIIGQDTPEVNPGEGPKVLSKEFLEALPAGTYTFQATCSGDPGWDGVSPTLVVTKP
jgi:hypothetical protein